MADFNLKDVFLSMQEDMLSSLQSSRKAIQHPGTKGDASELNWKEFLGNYLPKRYSVSDGFVVDSEGGCSDQIDIIVFDRQYSPLLFNQSGVIYVPAESVYAVLEVKQDITRDNIQYAGKKAASVRRLERTSVPIHHVDGVSKGREPGYIFAGLLATGFQPKTKFQEALQEELAALEDIQKLDIGCSLEGGSFEVAYQEDGSISELETKPDETCLVFFLMRLIQCMQSQATVTALDYKKYERFL